MFLRFADTKSGSAWPYAGAAAEPNLLFVQAPMALWESDQLATIDLPVANAVMETVPD